MKNCIYLTLLLYYPFLGQAQLPTFNSAFQTIPQGDYNNSLVKKVVLDSQNNTFCTGMFSGTVDFDPSSGVQNLTSNGVFDIFIAKYSPTNQLIWVKQIGGTGNDIVADIAVDPYWGEVYITGDFKGTVDFDPGINTFNLTAQNTGLISGDIFLSKFTPNGDFSWAFSVGNTGSNYYSGLEVKINVGYSNSMVYLLANFSGVVDIDPSSNTQNVNSGSNNQVNSFIAKYDRNMNFYSGFNLPGALISTFYLKESFGSIDTELIVAGITSQTVDYDPGPGTYSMSYIPGFFGNSFMVRYNPDLTVAAGALSTYTNQYRPQQIDVLNERIIVSNIFKGSYDVDYSPTQSKVLSSNNGLALAAYDSDFNLIWGHKVVNSMVDNLPNGRIAIDQVGGSISVLGTFSGTNDFDPSSTTANGSASNFYSVFYANYDLEGNYRNHFVLANDNFNNLSELGNGHAIAIQRDASNNNTNVTLAGNFLSRSGISADFDPAPSSTYLLGNTTNTAETAFIARYKMPNSIYLSDNVSDVVAGNDFNSMTLHNNFNLFEEDGCNTRTEYKVIFELSDLNGDFTNPTLLDTRYFPSGYYHGLTLQIPTSTPQGSNYRIRATTSEIRQTTNICSANPSVTFIPISPLSALNNPFSISTGCPQNVEVHNYGNQGLNIIAQDYITVNANPLTYARTTGRIEVLYSAGKAIIIDANSGSVFTATAINQGSTGEFVFEAKIEGCQ